MTDAKIWNYCEHLGKNIYEVTAIREKSITSLSCFFFKGFEGKKKKSPSRETIIIVCDGEENWKAKDIFW